VEPRDGNLFEPLDDVRGSDHGSHGPFDDRSGRTVKTHFLRTLPTTMAEVVGSVRDRLAEVIGATRRSTAER